MDDKYKVLITARFAKELLEGLEKSIASVQYSGWGVTRELLGEDQLIRELEGVDIFISEYETISRRVIQSSEQLKLIACCRNEPVASIDVDAATERGIPVLYPPGRNAVSVAEYAFGLMINLSRHIHEVYHLMKYTHELTRVEYKEHARGRMGFPSEWSFDASAPLVRFGGPELAGKVLGIVGIGAIGSQLAKRAKAFNMAVITHDPYVSDDYIESFGAARIPLDELFRLSDYIVIAARVRQDNRGMINTELLDSMKPTAYFINIARAILVDYDALYRVLKNNRIAGAALDVYPREPIPADDPFLQLDHVICSPHLAGSSTDVERYHSSMAVEDIASAIEGKRPARIFNPESWEKSYFYRNQADKP
jgi:D-3-phosphoglycerate dehydrogenase